MSERAIARGAPGLYGPPSDPEAAPEAWPGARRLSPRALRRHVAAADAAQLVGMGLLLRLGFPAGAFDLASTVGLGLLAALLAALARGALRNGRAADGPGMAGRGALSTAIAVATMGAVGAVVLADGDAMPADMSAWFGGWFLAATAGSAALRHAARRFSGRLTGGERLVLVGPPDRTQALARALAERPDGGWQLGACIDDRDARGLARLPDLFGPDGAVTVAVTVGGADIDARIARLCEHIADQPVRICLALDTAALSAPPRHRARIGRFALLDIFEDPLGDAGGVAKRGMDLVLGALALVAFSPVMALAALAIRLESPGPVMFRQWRFGLGSRPILVLKFRTMRMEGCDAGGARRTLARDPRVTRVGRLLRRSSIDELPQLLNVLRGEMSLVGPRPHPLQMRVGDASYGDAVERYRARHRVKPGITGWAQVNGSRGEVDTLEKARRRVALDLWYLENWSLWLDLRILLRTAFGGFASPKAD